MELNILLPKVNNFDIKQKKYQVDYMSTTPIKIWEDKGLQNIANFGHKTRFFVKTELQHI